MITWKVMTLLNRFKSFDDIENYEKRKIIYLNFFFFFIKEINVNIYLIVIVYIFKICI